MTQLALTPNIRATACRDRPASTALTIRSRRSSEKGFAIHAGLLPSGQDEPHLHLIRESPYQFRLPGIRSSRRRRDLKGPLRVESTRLPTRINGGISTSPRPPGEDSPPALQLCAEPIARLARFLCPEIIARAAFALRIRSEPTLNQRRLGVGGSGKAENRQSVATANGDVTAIRRRRPDGARSAVGIFFFTHITQEIPAARTRCKPTPSAPVISLLCSQRGIISLLTGPLRLSCPRRRAARAFLSEGRLTFPRNGI